MHAPLGRRVPRSPRTGIVVLVAALLAIPALATGTAASGASAHGTAAPSPARDYGLREVGRGELRWLGLGVYEARLWSPDGRFDGDLARRPLALSLDYRRAFSRAALVKITTGEWDRLGLGTPAERGRWKAELERLWHDVERGDRLIAVVVPGTGTRFYDGHRRLGSIADPAFGPAFLSIWLDPRTAVQDLRTQLLGGGER